ncbi:ankyrin repeat domain-containing protein [Massilia sp. P8910]|uniref:ankyrin repeat domain-containing protein n=1 Tax=Massilia antarctica TaxID=2765360 RepID=UPI001E51FEAB|nr:ankyrin repeat domain-containing protein [Massilia antarctica]MCE3605725.1 ankyrin repeat domain-containing protein [Massilia antarctica]
MESSRRRELKKIGKQLVQENSKAIREQVAKRNPWPAGHPNWVNNLRAEYASNQKYRKNTLRVEDVFVPSGIESLECETALTRAIDNGDLHHAEELLVLGADANEPNRLGESPLMIAAGLDNVHALDLLVANGADVNQAYHQGFTALHMAVDASIGNTILAGGSPGDEPTAAIRWLLTHGANTEARTHQGETAFDIAQMYNATSVGALILQGGDDPA